MHMQIAAGLPRLGHDVYYMESTSAWPCDPVRRSKVHDSEYAGPYVAGVAEGFGMGDRWAYRRSYSDHSWFGMDRAGTEELLTSADVVFNVSGATHVRRGAPAEAYARTVIEHHGGPRRLVRFLAVIQPPKSVNWVLGSPGVTATGLGALGFLLPAGALAVGLAVLRTAVTIRATRLESGTMAVSADVVQELQAKMGQS